jgi:hypothetical protein
MFRGKLLLIALLLFPFLKISAQTLNKQNSFIPFDTVLNFVEQKYATHLYFEPKWFEKKRFHSSILDLPLPEIINLIKNTGNCSFIVMDSSSIVFVPAEPSDISIPQVSTNKDFITIGNPDEYGKFSKASIHGKVVDGKTGEPLAGAGIYVEKTKTKAISDKNGHFNITLPVGEYDIKLSYIGYEDNQNKIRLVSNGLVNFEIMEKSIKLGDVIITAERVDNNLLNTQMSLLTIDRKGVKELPVTLGEIDIIKSVILLPGIQTIGEFGTGFNVRGGSADQNLILIEDVPIFNSSHLFGLTSILNPDGVSGVIMMKAGIPAKYGERASSLMDIHLGNTSFEKIKARGGIGLLNSRLTVEVPIVKNKINILVGGRATYSNWLLHSIPDIDLMNSSAKFYDLNSLLTITPNNNNKITAFGYYSNDIFAFSNTMHYQYSSTLASVRWNHIFNQKFSTSLVAGLSNYDYDVNELDTLSKREAYEIKSRVLYKNAKWNLTCRSFDNHVIDIGVNAVLYSIKPGDLSPYTQQSLVIPVSVPQEQAHEFALYASDNINISPKLSAEVGIRYGWYALKGPGSVYVYQNGYDKSTENIIDTVNYTNKHAIKKYGGLEPRMSLRYSINDLSSIKFSYNRINQYINLASNTSVMTPSDVWKLSDTYMRPLKCDQYAIGYFRNFHQNVIETSVELYYKSLKNIIEYKNGAQILINTHLETDLVNATGYNYGAEFYVKKNTGRLTGWVSYTYSRSMRKTTGLFSSEQVNNNHYFPSNYDKPHNMVLNLNYHISRRWRFASSFTYNTGRPVTLPELKYQYNSYQLIYYSDRNKYRLPDYHRLDVSITLDETLRLKRKWKGSWTLSIINLYGRKNAYSVFYQKDMGTTASNNQQYNLYKLYIIGRPLPTLTYNFSF